jgi:hypothetical protein
MRRSLVSEQDGQRLPWRKFGEGARRAGHTTIDFRLTGGRRRGLKYLHLVEPDYNPDAGGIHIEFVGHKVVIEGRNLEALYEGLCDEEIGEITERHANDLGLDEREPYIERIRIERV